MPTAYCGGTENVFRITNLASVAQIEWEFEDLTPGGTLHASASALGLVEWSPNFGYDRSLQYQISKGTGSPGAVSAYRIRARARTGCGFWTLWSNWYQDNNVNYATCDNGSPAEAGNGGNGNPNSQSFSIDLLPNPASNHVTIEIPQGNGGMATIRITDSFGSERKLMNTSNTTESVNISDLPLGVYNVTVTKGNDFDTKHLQVLP